MRFYKEQSELFEGIQNGDADAFEYVFKTYYPRLRNYANRFVSDSDDLEDILQNCFIHLWERRDSITFISISSLLFTMVRNGCLNYLKHQTMVNGYEAGSLSKIPGAEELYSTDMKGTTDSDTLYNELTRQIEQVMEELSPRCREIFTMSRFEGLKNREIADQLGISVKVVEKHITKALAVFRTHSRRAEPPRCSCYGSSPWHNRLPLSYSISATRPSTSGAALRVFSSLPMASTSTETVITTAVTTAGGS